MPNIQYFYIVYYSYYLYLLKNIYIFFDPINIFGNIQIKKSYLSTQRVNIYIETLIYLWNRLFNYLNIASYNKYICISINKKIYKILDSKGYTSPVLALWFAKSCANYKRDAQYLNSNHCILFVHIQVFYCILITKYFFKLYYILYIYITISCLL